MSSTAPPKMSSAEFLTLDHPIDTQRWQLALTAKVSGGRGFLLGFETLRLMKSEWPSMLGLTPSRAERSTPSNPIHAIEGLTVGSSI